MDDAGDITCVFSDKLPEIPYIRPSNYLGNIYNAEFTETKTATVHIPFQTQMEPWSLIP